PGVNPHNAICQFVIPSIAATRNPRLHTSSETERHESHGSALQLIDLRGQNKVALREPVDLVRPNGDFRAPPGEQNVGMMSLLLGDGAQRVDEIEGLPKIGKCETSRQVVFVDYLPMRNLFGKIGQRSTLKWRHTAAARNTSFGS